MVETYKDESRVNWHRADSRARGSDSIITIGCLQRIAEAVEKMASSYDLLRGDRDYQKQRKEVLEAECKRMARANAALRGHLKREKGAHRKLLASLRRGGAN